MMPTPDIHRLFVEHSVRRLPMVDRIRQQLAHARVELVDEAADAYQWVGKQKDPISAGKKVLLLSRNRGAFVRPCPGTRNYTCCNYRILHIGNYCPMDCAYCILQTYFHPPILQLFVNDSDRDAELRRVFKSKQKLRMGTGEYTDSLVWECFGEMARPLVEQFARQNHCVLELKTKTDWIDHLADLDHNCKTIVSWSLNTEFVRADAERHTASIQQRLAAARRCQKWGYPVGFHFDPMVMHSGWEKAYRQVVDQLFDHVDPGGVIWISLGTYRFPRSMKPIVQRRFPDSGIPYGEFIRGLDAKMRYFKPLRIEMYRAMANWIRQRAPQAMVYLCMESDAVWRQALGFSPRQFGGLPTMLDRSAALHGRLDAADRRVISPSIEGVR